MLILLSPLPDLLNTRMEHNRQSVVRYADGCFGARKYAIDITTIKWSRLISFESLRTDKRLLLLSKEFIDVEVVAVLTLQLLSFLQ